jgi:hypothetical protein
MDNRSSVWSDISCSLLGALGALVAFYAVVYFHGTTGAFGTKTACLYKLCLTIMP